MLLTNESTEASIPIFILVDGDSVNDRLNTKADNLSFVVVAFQNSISSRILDLVETLVEMVSLIV